MLISAHSYNQDMRNSRYRFSRLVMVIAAILFIGAGGYLVVRSAEFLRYLGMPGTSGESELVTLLGVIMLGLGIHQATTSRNAADPAFRRAALLSVAMHGAVAFLLYTGSEPTTTLRTVLVGVFAFFGLVYLVTLPIKPVGYKEQPPA